jgi:hypothetical protein
MNRKKKVLKHVSYATKTIGAEIQAGLRIAILQNFVQKRSPLYQATSHVGTSPNQDSMPERANESGRRCIFREQQFGVAHNCGR